MSSVPLKLPERRGAVGRNAAVPGVFWFSTAFLLLLWQVLDQLNLVNKQLLPSPLTIVETVIELAEDGTLTAALAASLPRVVPGLLIGVSLGIFLGFASAYWKVSEIIVDRPIQMVRSIPFVALMPLLILWFGIDDAPKIILIAIASGVPLYLNTLSGIRNVDQDLVEAGRVYKFNAAQVAFRVLIPGALPQILSGLRYGLGVGWAALVVAESVGANSGIGFVLINARQFVRTDVVLVCLSIYALLGALSDYGVRLLERHLLAWRHGFQN